MSNTGLWPWPDPNNHEIQMLLTKRRELEAVNKSQAEKIKRLQAAMSSLMESYRELDYACWREHHAPGVDTYTPATIEDYGLLPSDMEADNE